MNRKLTKQEKTLTEKGIRERGKRLDDYKEGLQYTKDTKQFHDKWKKYLEHQEVLKKKREYDALYNAIDTYTQNIAFEEKAIEEAKRHIKEGVKVKEKPTGVQ